MSVRRDGTITAAKLDADTDTKKKAFRNKIDAAAAQDLIYTRTSSDTDWSNSNAVQTFNLDSGKDIDDYEWIILNGWASSSTTNPFVFNERIYVGDLNVDTTPSESSHPKFIVSRIGLNFGILKISRDNAGDTLYIQTGENSNYGKINGIWGIV